MHWSLADLPVILVIDSRISPEEQAAWTSGANLWNFMTGAPIFSVVVATPQDITKILRSSRPGIIIATTLHPDEPEYVAGIARMNAASHSGRIARVMVEMTPYLDEDTKTVTAVHELGHALGLAHDEDDHRSIMYPSVRDATESTVQPEDIAYVASQFHGCGG